MTSLDLLEEYEIELKEENYQSNPINDSITNQVNIIYKWE